MPLLNITIGVRQSDSATNTSELTSLPTTDSSFSAGSIATVDSFVHPEVEPFTDDDEESYDPYLKPLSKERRERTKLTNKVFPSIKKIIFKEPGTPDTVNLSIRDSSSSVHQPGFSFFPSFPSFSPPTTLKIPLRKTAVEPEARSEESTDVIHVEEKPSPFLKERDYWNKIANGRLDDHGIIHIRTAEALIQLGNSHMRCDEYKEALTVYKGSARIFRRINGNCDASLAMALNKVGLAACQLNKDRTNLENALGALNQALLIRYEVFGPTHVDTIDTLNNMAGVYLHLQELQEARQAYFEVWTLRQAVFGPQHPSVAVAAHCLGGVYLRLSDVEGALKYFRIALDIYDKLHLSDDHPTVARLLVDMNGLCRVMSSMGYR